MTDLSLYEDMCGIRFTDLEREALDNYNQKTRGVQDCLDAVEISDLSHFTAGPHDVPTTFRMHYEWLNEWWWAIEALADSGDWGWGSGKRISEPLFRFIRDERDKHDRAREHLTALAVEQLLGIDDYGNQYYSPRSRSRCCTCE